MGICYFWKQVYTGVRSQNFFFFSFFYFYFGGGGCIPHDQEPGPNN